jgi:N-acetylglutamate synthase-like GNAT family acetyltransferase
LADTTAEAVCVRKALVADVPRIQKLINSFADNNEMLHRSLNELYETLRDFFVIEDFLNAIRTGKSPIDVYDAAAWSVIRPLSADSVKQGGKPMDIPDFRASA